MITTTDLYLKNKIINNLDCNVNNRHFVGNKHEKLLYTNMQLKLQTDCKHKNVWLLDWSYYIQKKCQANKTKIIIISKIFEINDLVLAINMKYMLT